MDQEGAGQGTQGSATGGLLERHFRLSERGTTAVGAKDITIAKGDVLIIPAGTPHKWEDAEEFTSYVVVRIDLRQFGDQWLPKQDLPADWPSHRYKEIVNADGIPSEEIVDLQASRQDPPERPGDELLAEAREVALQIRQ